jgi:mono/diheme cytochrome c family protein
MRTLAVLILFALSSPVFAADLSKSEKKLAAEIQASIRTAGKEYSAGEYEKAGQAVLQAMKQAESAVKEGSPELFDALQPSMQRISRAHTLLEFEGVSLPPFRRPERPDPRLKPEPKPKPAKPKTAKSRPRRPKPSPPAPNQTSFTEVVAPILVSRCGRCHVADSKGKFSMATYAALMKGPPEGVVIFAGDFVGSRLIETIESGDMPRGGGKVTPTELATLKAWIQTGAKFDGPEPDAPIDGKSMPVPTTNNPRPMVRKATGNETVSFSRDVAPLLIDNCKGCHLQAMTTRGGLKMDTFAQLLRGGDSGSVIETGSGEASLLIKKLTGTEGQRMPAGGRPPLSDESISLISTWIDEGATLDGASESQPLTVMSQLAWAKMATPEEISKRRQLAVERNLGIVASGKEFQSKVTDNFFVVGPVAEGTVDLVADLAESSVNTAASLVPAGDGQLFRGRATVIVLPKRYDYSEFAKMVEQRSLPTDWSSHWKFDGIDAYIAVVASNHDDETVIAQRLTPAIVSLAVATQGSGVPHWLADGVGRAITKKQSNRGDREAARNAESELIEAVSVMKNAKQFLDGKMTPEQTDRTGTAIAASMLEGKRRRSFDRTIGQLADGKSFEEAFGAAYGMTLEMYVEAWRASWGR